MQTYIDMAQPMTMMVQSMNEGAPMPGLDIAVDFAKSAAKLMSVFSGEYEGG